MLKKLQNNAPTKIQSFQSIMHVLWDNEELAKGIGYIYLPEIKEELEMNPKTNHALVNYSNFELTMQAMLNSEKIFNGKHEQKQQYLFDVWIILYEEIFNISNEIKNDMIETLLQYNITLLLYPEVFSIQGPKYEDDQPN